MLTRSLAAGFRRSFACASVSLATVALASAAQAKSPEFAENSPEVVVRSDILPDANPPGGALDNTVDVTGVGQMRTITNLTTGVGFVCTGTLINPRTVIFAAHCVNDVPSSVYGNATSGIPISFGFEANNLAARRIWAGLDPVTGAPAADQSLKFKTNPGRSLYNVEQVWYDPRSLDPVGFEFLQADVAIATLDTHADGIPTWAMLFTPLTGPTHALVNGYGARGSNGTSGANLGVDSRRRIAENMIDFLGSLDDRDKLLFTDILGFPADPPFGVSTNYQLDFDDPAGVTVGLPGGFNFDIFPGAALAREGTTAGGDSGGPLIVDQKYTQKVVAGVLSGGTRFFGPQPFSSYGTTSFYQPLFLYWDQIVANNPYVYASAKTGSRNWFDPTHWVQDMDPNYKIDVNGALQTGLPNTPAQGIATNTPKFGDVCYKEHPSVGGFSQCLSIEGSTPAPGTGPILIPGGPGSTNFVPNNTTGNRLTGARANYYEVTLNKLGTTTLNQTATIDRLNLTGLAALSINNAGNLTVLGDYTQSGGALTVNGLLKTGEALVAAGLVSGSGKIDPTFMTVMQAAVLPGGFGNFGTLTVQGDLILTSAALLQMDVARNGADKLVVTGDAQNTGIASLGGTIFFVKPDDRPAPRHGQSFEIITATGGVEGTFNTVLGKQGVLRPQLTYNANNVIVTLHAGSLAANLLGSSAAAQSFAQALDTLRGSSYNSLYGLYGAIDVMDPAALTSTLSNLTPRNAGEALAMTHDQTGVVRSLVSDRLSVLGTGETRTGRFTVIGAPETLGLGIGQTQLSASSASQLSFARRYAPSQMSYGRLPDKVSGFISGGYDGGSLSFAGSETGANRTSWHMAMGLEMEAASNLTLGTAFGLVDGQSMLSGSRAESRTSQAIGYGSYRLGGGAYVAGLASVSYSTIGLQRGVTTGIDRFSLNGTTRALSYDLQAEASINLDVARGLIVTPRASVRYAANEISGFRERGGEIALLVDDLKDRRVEGRLGARLSGSTALGRSGWSFTPQLSADMVRTVAGGETSITVRFAEAAEFAFALPAFSQDRSWGEMRGGFQLSSGPLSFGAAVQSDVGRSDYRDNRAVADVTLRF